VNLIESRLYDRESIKEVCRCLVRAKQYSTFACQMACQVTLSKARSWAGLSKLPRDGTQVFYIYDEKWLFQKKSTSLWETQEKTPEF